MKELEEIGSALEADVVKENLSDIIRDLSETILFSLQLGRNQMGY